MEGDLGLNAHEGLLRVVVWNVNHKATAWEKLETLHPDICLLNEAVVPSRYEAVWSPSGTRGRDNAKRPWSVAVTSRFPLSPITDARPRWRQTVRNVPFECSRPGSWEAALVETPLGRVAAISLYGLLDEFSDASVHRSLSEVSPVLDDSRYNDLVILGGDLNTGTQWSKREQHWNLRDGIVLGRIEAYGLVDCLKRKRPRGRLEGCRCLDGDECTHTRTRRDRRYPNIPYQNDYLFASEQMALRLHSCKALASDDWFAISDHAPIVADFAL